MLKSKIKNTYKRNSEEYCEYLCNLYEQPCLALLRIFNKVKPATENVLDDAWVNMIQSESADINTIKKYAMFFLSEKVYKTLINSGRIDMSQVNQKTAIASTLFKKVRGWKQNNLENPMWSILFSLVYHLIDWDEFPKCKEVLLKIMAQFKS